MVRAERDGRLFDAFKEKSAVAIGWNEVGDLSAVKTRKAITDLVTAAWPETKPQSAAMAAGQLHRFVNEIEVGDMIVTGTKSSGMVNCAFFGKAPRSIYAFVRIAKIGSL